MHNPKYVSVVYAFLAIVLFTFSHYLSQQTRPRKSANYDFPRPIKYNSLYSHLHLPNLVS